MGLTSPELWILGSTDYGAQLGAYLGLPYAYAYFFTEGRGTEQALELYRRLYRPSERHPLPHAPSASGRWQRIRKLAHAIY